MLLGDLHKSLIFLSGSYINHALTVNPHVYISCIKQFWNTAMVKRSGDVTRLQALVDKKRIVITEEVVREILQLNDAEGVICLPNDEIFAGLARIGYEKPSTKLTLYKAFFSTHWKFFIHTILHSLSAKRTSWNEFSSLGDEGLSSRGTKLNSIFITAEQGVGLDELKHDLSTKESAAQKCKDVIVENKCEIISLSGANIEPNKADSEEVADLDPDQLPTSAFVVLVSSIIPILNLSHQTFSHIGMWCAGDLLVAPSS
nr:hypothetical protein [Tanacetum cinerariifolium]